MREQDYKEEGKLMKRRRLLAVLLTCSMLAGQTA